MCINRTKGKIPHINDALNLWYRSSTELEKFLRMFPSLTSDPVTDPRSVVDFLGGESVAINRLHHYLWETDAIATYKETRNGLLGADYSTKFSVW